VNNVSVAKAHEADLAAFLIVDKRIKNKLNLSHTCLYPPFGCHEKTVPISVVLHHGLHFKVAAEAHR